MTGGAAAAGSKGAVVFGMPMPVLVAVVVTTGLLMGAAFGPISLPGRSSGGPRSERMDYTYAGDAATISALSDKLKTGDIVQITDVVALNNLIEGYGGVITFSSDPSVTFYYPEGSAAADYTVGQTVTVRAYTYVDEEDGETFSIID